MSEMNRRDIVKTGGSMLILGAAGGLPSIASAQATVKLGLLHSLSGTIAIADPLFQALLSTFYGGVPDPLTLDLLNR